jgi:CRP-like cAMP-binding protein
MKNGEEAVQTDILLKRLRTFEFLRGLDDMTLATLAKSAVWKVFAPNAVVFWEGAIESNLYYLQYGSLKVLKEAGKKIKVRHIKKESLCLTQLHKSILQIQNQKRSLPQRVPNLNF